MAYDNESSQAANHALALIGSSDSLFKTESQENAEKSPEEIAQRYNIVGGCFNCFYCW